MRVNAQPIYHRDYSWTIMKTNFKFGQNSKGWWWLLKSQYIILSNKFLSWKNMWCFFSWSLFRKLWLMWLIVNDSTEVFTYWMFIQASWCVILLVIKSWNGSNYIYWTKSLPHIFVFAGHENSLAKVHHFDASLCYNSGQFLPELDFLSLDHFTTNVLYRGVSFWCVKGKQRKKTCVKTCTFVR